MNKREIKFRVWDKLKKIFLPDDVYSIINRTSFNAFGQMITDWEDYKEGEYFYDNAQELVLFTGLKDKLKTDCYEGDILENPEGKRGLVVFYDGCFILQIKSLNYITMNQGYMGNKTIIGNIYENPELLITKK